jgi:hypothetical protein
MYVIKNEIDVNKARTPEEGAHSPSWPNGLIIIIIMILILIMLIVSGPPSRKRYGAPDV